MTYATDQAPRYLDPEPEPNEEIAARQAEIGRSLADVSKKFEALETAGWGLLAYEITVKLASLYSRFAKAASMEEVARLQGAIEQLEWLHNLPTNLNREIGDLRQEQAELSG